MRRSLVPLLFALTMFYAIGAFVAQWWPFTKSVAGCPNDSINYHLYVDITTSNVDRSNWIQQLEQIVGRLRPCDCVHLGVIDDLTGTEKEDLTISLPFVDEKEGVPFITRGKFRAARLAVNNRLNELLTQSTPDLSERAAQAKVTDILSVFNRLDHLATPPSRDWLVIFSDGLESAAGTEVDKTNHKILAVRTADRINLENTCIRDNNLEKLLDNADKVLTPSGSLGQFAEVDWVVSGKTGMTSCNSITELRTFWEKVMEKEAGGAMPRVKFETNPF
jgi:hypothetical protein